MAAAFLSALVPYFINAQQVASATGVWCHHIEDGGEVPEGFAAPYSLIPNLPGMQLSVFCGYDNKARLVINSNSTFHTYYVYKGGYYWNYTSNAWKPLTMESESKLINKTWYKDNAYVHVNFGGFSLGKKPLGYFLGYSCLYDGATWFCGCTTSACTAPRWQVQTWDPIPAQLTLTLEATPATIAKGATTTLAWKSENAETCHTEDEYTNWFGPQGTSGEATVSPTADRTFSLICKNAGNDIKKQVKVTVQAKK